MPQGNPQPGEKYMHFKDRMYEVTDIAYHSETMEKYVVYRALYDDHKTYIRPYDMFISEVDREKYPMVSQRYRFRYIDPDGDNAMDDADIGEGKAVSDQSWVDRILDAGTPEERYDIVCSIRGDITDRLIEDIATVMDISIPEGDLEERYRQLKECMRTIQKYESDRLR